MSLRTLHRRRALSIALPPLSDVDAQAYVVAAEIPNDETVYYSGETYERTGAQICDAINNYTIGLKSIGLWDVIGYDYPMLGGSAPSHAISLKTPSQYVIDWFGGWVHDGLGAKPNGQNTKSRTYFIPADHQVETSNGITIAVGTNETQLYGDGGEIGCMIGAQFDSTSQFIGVSLDNNLFFNRMNGADQRFTNTDAKGVYTITRTNTTTKTFKNNVLMATKTNANGVLPVGVDVGIGNCMVGTSGQVDNNGWGIQRIQGAIGHEGLTDQQALDLQQLIDTREIALGRKTW